jgi:hypothetical protein
LGAVDRYLSEKGCLVLLEHPTEFRTKIRLTRWQRPTGPKSIDGAVLSSVVQNLISILEKRPTYALNQEPTSAHNR